MSQYSDEELLALTRNEAEAELSEEELKRFNSLKAEELHKQIDEHKEEKKKENIEGLGQLLSDVQEDMISTVEIAGNKIDILIDPDEHDIQRVKRAQKLASKNKDNLAKEDAEEIKEELLSILGQYTVNYTADDWREEFEARDVGLIGLGRVLTPMLDTVKEELEQKKSR